MFDSVHFSKRKTEMFNFPFSNTTTSFITLVKGKLHTSRGDSIKNGSAKLCILMEAKVEVGEWAGE